MKCYLGDELNLYAYVKNNPVMYVDLSGHAAACADKLAAIYDLQEMGFTEREAIDWYYGES